jgi:urease accessory protein
MIIFTQLATAQTATQGLATLTLSFEKRQKTRARHSLTTGTLGATTQLGFDLPRGTVLKEGDVIQAASGEQVLVHAAIEQLLEVRAKDSQALARIAYHLGNRHVAVDVSSEVLRLELDHVLENMVQGLGGSTCIVNAAFNPETGAYSGHHHANASELPESYADSDQDPERFRSHLHAPRIHDFVTHPLGTKVGAANSK